MIEWQEDTSLILEWPLVFTAYNREGGLKPVTTEDFNNPQDIYVDWLNLMFTFSVFPGEYYNNNLNDNLFRIFNKSTLTVTFTAHSQLLMLSCSIGTPM